MQVHVQDFETSEMEPNSLHWLDLIDHMKIKAFAETTVAKTYREGVQHLVRIAGVGALKPNTAVLRFHEDVGCSRRRDYFRDPSSRFKSERMDHLFAEDLTSGVDGAAAALDDQMESSLEFVRTVGDILKIGKNICVYRQVSIIFC